MKVSHYSDVIARRHASPISCA